MRAVQEVESGVPRRKEQVEARHPKRNVGEGKTALMLHT